MASRKTPRTPPAKKASSPAARSGYKFRTLDPDEKTGTDVRADVLAAYEAWYVADVELERARAAFKATPAGLLVVVGTNSVTGEPVKQNARELAKNTVQAAVLDEDAKRRRLNRKCAYSGVELVDAEKNAVARRWLTGWLSGVLEPTYAVHLSKAEERRAAAALTGDDAPTEEEAAVLAEKAEVDEAAAQVIRAGLDVATKRLDALPEPVLPD